MEKIAQQWRHLTEQRHKEVARHLVVIQEHSHGQVSWVRLKLAKKILKSVLMGFCSVFVTQWRTLCTGRAKRKVMTMMMMIMVGNQWVYFTGISLKKSFIN
uniref:Uncharacterized protein n=1 Tax=Cacopsylla melanoneura TaxID=428564 RepID=A0A8D8WTW3_9HEMI